MTKLDPGAKSRRILRLSGLMAIEHIAIGLKAPRFALKSINIALTSVLRAKYAAEQISKENEIPLPGNND